MKHYIRPNQQTDLSSTKPPPPVDPPLSEISVQSLIDDGLLALYREVKNIVIASSKGKLDAPTAKDLRDHLKLLFELKDRESQSLKGMTDEQLEAKAKAALEPQDA